MLNRKKGQAALEFLTTYSWAIMIILLTVGALTYFDIFNTSRFISERCETGAQISCVEAAVSESGDFKIRLTNNYPVDIVVESLSVSHLGTTRTENVDEEFGRGETNEIDFSLDSDLSLSSNNREMFDIEIKFKRSGGDNSYDILGNIVLRPLPEDVFNS